MKNRDKKRLEGTREIQELEALYEIGKILTSELNLQKVLKRILEKALEITKSDYGTLGLLSSDRAMLTYDVIIPESAHTPPQRIGQGITGQVARMKKAKSVPDVHKDPDYIEVFSNMNSELAVPLIFGDELIGVLNVESPKPDAFDQHNKRLLEGLASYATIAIQNARLFGHTDRKLRERVEELETLQSIDQTISSTLDVSDVLNLILRKGEELIQNRHKNTRIYGTILLIDKATGELVIRASLGVPKGTKDTRARIGETGITGLVARNKRSLLIPDVTEEQWQEWYIGMIPGVKSELAVPLILGKERELIGIFNLESPASGVFDDDDRRLIESLAQQAVIAISNAEEFETLNSIYEIGKVISSTLNTKRILELILDKGIEKSGAHSGSARFFNGRKDELVPQIRRGLKTKKSWDPIKIGQGIVGSAAKEKKTIRVPDVRQDRRYLCFNPNTKSELAIRILSQTGGLIGVLNFEHPITGSFKRNDVIFAESLAGQAAIAIQNARLLKRTKRQYEELKDAQEQLSAANALAWLGIVSASWKHDVIQKAHAITVAVNSLKLDISEEPLAQILDRIDSYANSIMAVAPDLPSEDAVEPVFVEVIIDSVVRKWCDVRNDIKVNFPRLQATPLIIEANVAWLTLAFEHLVKNALRAMPDGGELTIGCKSTRDRVLVEIEDTGCGIPENIQRQLFKRQVSGAKGSGVGLLLVKTILLRYGGNIRLVRTGPKGTAFSLWLPITETKD